MLRTGSIMRGNDPSRNREILLALDQVFAWYRSRQCFTRFQEELCGMTLQHISYACYRVLLQDPHHPLIPQFLEYLTSHFPTYRTSKYYHALTRSQRVILFFLRHRQYRLPALLLEWKEKKNSK